MPWGSVAGWGKKPVSGVSPVARGRRGSAVRMSMACHEHTEAAPGTAEGPHDLPAGLDFHRKGLPGAQGLGSLEGEGTLPSTPASTRSSRLMTREGSRAREPFLCAQLLFLLKTLELEPHQGTGDANVPLRVHPSKLNKILKQRGASLAAKLLRRRNFHRQGPRLILLRSEDPTSHMAKNQKATERNGNGGWTQIIFK